MTDEELEFVIESQGATFLAAKSKPKKAEDKSKKADDKKAKKSAQDKKAKKSTGDKKAKGSDKPKTPTKPAVPELQVQKKRYGVVTGKTYAFLKMKPGIECTASPIVFLDCYRKNWETLKVKSATDRWYCAIWGKQRGECLRVSQKGQLQKDPGVKFRLETDPNNEPLSGPNNYCQVPDKNNRFTCFNYMFYKEQKCKNKVTFNKLIPKCAKNIPHYYNRFLCGKPVNEIVTCWDGTKTLMRKCYNLRSNKAYWRCNTMLVSKYNKRKILWIAYRSFLRKPDETPFPGW